MEFGLSFSDEAVTSLLEPMVVLGVNCLSFQRRKELCVVIRYGVGKRHQVDFGGWQSDRGSLQVETHFPEHSACRPANVPETSTLKGPAGSSCVTAVRSYCHALNARTNVRDVERTALNLDVTPASR